MGLGGIHFWVHSYFDEQLDTGCSSSGAEACACAKANVSMVMFVKLHMVPQPYYSTSTQLQEGCLLVNLESEIQHQKSDQYV